MNARRALDRGSRAALAVVMVFLSIACATSTGGGAPLLLATASRPQSSAVTLDVTNRGWSDVVIYLADGATPKRLGSVPPLKETRLLVYRGSGPLRILVRPIGSTEAFSPEPVWVGPGQTVELTVQPLLATSELFVH